MTMLRVKILIKTFLITAMCINHVIFADNFSNCQQIDLDLYNTPTNYSQLEYILGDANNFRSVSLDYNNTSRQPHKKWTLMIYVAADNDLFYFAWNNIRQLAQSAHCDINIIVFFE